MSDERISDEHLAAIEGRFAVNPLWHAQADMRELISEVHRLKAQQRTNLNWLREFAEVWLYDGDADRPLDGYNDLLEFTDRIAGAGSD